MEKRTLLIAKWENMSNYSNNMVQWKKNYTWEKKTQFTWKITYKLRV